MLIGRKHQIFKRCQRELGIVESTFDRSQVRMERQGNGADLILVTHKGDQPLDAYLKWIDVCVQSGISAVQLREKNLSDQALYQFGQALKATLDLTNTPLIINDNVDLCLKLDAAGVHLGQSDGDPIQAKDRLGADKIIGLSVDTMDQLQKANMLELDYIGVGAIFPTQSKPDVKTIWGLDGLKQAVLNSLHRVIAIGGIHQNNALAVLQTGVSGIAAIRAFHDVNAWFFINDLIKHRGVRL